MTRLVLQGLILTLLGVLVISGRAGPAAKNLAALNRALLEAAEMGDVEGAKSALDAGADVNARNRDGATPLLLAADGSFIENVKPRLVRLLITRGADVQTRDKAGNTALMGIAAGDNEGMLPFLLAQGAQINAQNTEGETALFYALAENRKVLLDNGADVNHRNKRGETPLMQIVNSAEPETTQLLLRYGADPNLRDHQGQTALMKSNGYHDNLLLRAGADPNLRDNKGETALMKAIDAAGYAEYGVATFKLLLAHGANVNLRNKRGETALTLAVKYVNRDILKALLKAPQVSAPQRAALQKGLLSLALIEAAAYGDAAKVKVLLERGASVRAVVFDVNDYFGYSYSSGDTALMAAASSGSRDGDEDAASVRRKFPRYVAAARVLLAHGAKVNYHQSVPPVQDLQGDFALSRAVLSGNVAMVRLLLAHGANVNLRDGEGVTALMTAVSNVATRNATMIKLLLSRGADVHARSGPRYGRTVLMQAAAFGHPETVRLLLRRGARVNARDGSGETALTLAIRGDDTNRAETIIRLLLEAGADVNTRAKFGQTPLMIAATNGRRAIVKLLLKRRARVDAKDSDGQTALMMASTAHFYNHSAAGSDVLPPTPAIVRLLLARGASPNARAKDGSTALILAARFNYLASYLGGPSPIKYQMPRLVAATQVVRVLLAYKADVNLRDKNGNTALKWAKAHGYTAMSRLLKPAGA